MKPIVSLLLAASILMQPTIAIAGPKVEVQAVQIDHETARYRQGTVTVDRTEQDGAVQVTPVGMDHGSYVFSIVVYNLSNNQSNIDVGDVSLEAGGITVIPFTRKQLEKRAANRAAWAQFAVALAGGLSAYAAASQRDNYQTTIFTPRGTYSAFSSAPSTGGQVAAAAITAGTAYSIATIQSRLDETRRALGDQIVQLTTVDPGESYAGQVVLQKIKIPTQTLPAPFTVTVHWNARDYRFGFQLAKEDTRPPEFKTAMPNPGAIPESVPKLSESALPSEPGSAVSAPQGELSNLPATGVPK